jgi:hypothetical protein
MATYELITDADREFDNDYNYYASVLTSQHQPASNEDVREELLIVTEVDEAKAATYEAALDADSAVIHWVRLQD